MYEWRLEIHYKSPVAINMQASWDWQTVILQVMWFEDAHAVSDSIKCNLTTTTNNAFNNWGPIRDIESILHLPTYGAVLSVYQSSTYGGPHYFSIQYCTPTGFSFTDCKEKFKNKILYAMMLPPSCSVATIQPKEKLSLNNSNK